MKKSNYVVWPAPSSKFLKMARSPKSLATPDLEGLCPQRRRPWHGPQSQRRRGSDSVSPTPTGEDRQRPEDVAFDDVARHDGAAEGAGGAGAVEPVCAFIQKTAVEKSTHEIDKRLAVEFDLRHYGPLAVAYQEDAGTDPAEEICDGRRFVDPGPELCHAAGADVPAGVAGVGRAAGHHGERHGQHDRDPDAHQRARAPTARRSGHDPGDAAHRPQGRQSDGPGSL